MDDFIKSLQDHVSFLQRENSQLKKAVRMNGPFLLSVNNLFARTLEISKKARVSSLLIAFDFSSQSIKQFVSPHKDTSVAEGHLKQHHLAATILQIDPDR